MTEMADEFGVTQMSEALMMNMNLSQNEEDLEVASDLPLVLTNPTMAIPYLTAVILALVSGVFGNIFILVMVFIKKTLRHSGYELMVNLACADLCVTGIADPLCILGEMLLIAAKLLNIEWISVYSINDQSSLLNLMCMVCGIIYLVLQIQITLKPSRSDPWQALV